MSIGVTPTSSSGRTKSQLLPNRGVLQRINPVVHKKTKSRNILLPNEWEDTTSQAYRLLVGPDISNYVDKQDDNELQRTTTQIDKEKENEERHNILAKLVPSRLGNEKIEPSEVTVAQLDALSMPNDLLVQVLPQGVAPRYDLILGKKEKKVSKKLKLKKEPLPNLAAQLYEGEESNMLASVRSTKSFRSFVKQVIPEEEEENKEEVEVKPLESANKKENSETVSEKPIKTVSQLELQEQFKRRHQFRMRKIFYILRCWATYHINSRQKAKYILETMNTIKLLYYSHRWNNYVKRIKEIRKSHAELIEQRRQRITKSIYYDWKNKSSSYIEMVKKAISFHEEHIKQFSKKVFELFRDMCVSKKYAKREIERCFKFKPNGPFRPLNDYYTQVRDRNIKALHYYFVKNIPKFIRHWHERALGWAKDKDQTERALMVVQKYAFKKIFFIYSVNLHDRILSEIRRVSSKHIAYIKSEERKKAENVEKELMIKLIHDKNVFNAKLSQFDRLSQNHKEAVIKRKTLRKEIAITTNKYFIKQEELSLVDSFRQATDVEKKTHEIRVQLAEGFLFHLGRAVRSYDNQVIAHEFCLAFRVLSNPIVERAIGYFYEKKHLNALVASAVRSRKTLKQATTCVKLYHQNYGWSVWRAYIDKINQTRSKGIMAEIRRRTQVLQLYPYFNWVEVLPVRPPRPLKEVEMMFKDLPLVSIQRKVARERVHHVNVRMMLLRRRMLRDFLRAYASYVQEQVAMRAIILLMKKKRSIALCRVAFYAFKSKNGHIVRSFQTRQEREIQANIVAWFKHFFRARQNQRKLVTTIPLS